MVETAISAASIDREDPLDASWFARLLADPRLASKGGFCNGVLNALPCVEEFVSALATLPRDPVVYGSTLPALHKVARLETRCVPGARGLSMRDVLLEHLRSIEGQSVVGNSEFAGIHAVLVSLRG